MGYLEMNPNCTGEELDYGTPSPAMHIDNCPHDEDNILPVTDTAAPERRYATDN